MDEKKRRYTKKPVTAEKALQRLAALCARSEQCSADIRRKIAGYGLAPEECSEVLQKLVDNRFVDDRRYAGSVARDKVRFAGWGKAKIRMALYAKGLRGEIIDEALASIETADYKEALLRVARAKARCLDLRQRADRDKFVRHIVSRGFEPALAFRVLEAAVRKLEK